jgi:hypothetical protein
VYRARGQEERAALADGQSAWRRTIASRGWLATRSIRRTFALDVDKLVAMLRQLERDVQKEG